jgi:hypothetical protein
MTYFGQSACDAPAASALMHLEDRLSTGTESS